MDKINIIKRSLNQMYGQVENINGQKGSEFKIDLHFIVFSMVFMLDPEVLQY
jgi:hypothetical protein